MDAKSGEKFSEGESFKSKGGKKGNRAIGKPKPCSNSFGVDHQDTAADSEWEDFASEKNGDSANPFRPKPSSPLTEETGNADAQHQPRKMSQAELNDAEARVVDGFPLEDVPIDGASKGYSVNFAPQTVTRMMSEDTQDTNDTAPMSNRDPNRPPVHPSSPNVSNLNLDAFCSKYYNTPAGQSMHSTGALGDWISPVESPIEEDEEDEGERPRTSSNKDSKKMLEIPRMGLQLVRTASEASSLLGETLVEERKTGDGPSGRTRIVIRPSQNQAHRDTSSIVSESATFASASTFTSLEKGQAKRLTPHPFFWRTFPNVTVTSEAMQEQIDSSQQSSIQSRYQNNRAADLAALAAVRRAVQEHIRQHTVQIVNEDLPPGAECSPFVDQEVIKRLWMEGRQQRTAASIRLPGVFNRKEYQPPDNLNFAMG
ncbi:MAG: hypothetical protein SGBAC_008684 [Bacillariaceae sp.]